MESGKSRPPGNLTSPIPRWGWVHFSRFCGRRTHWNFRKKYLQLPFPIRSDFSHLVDEWPVVSFRIVLVRFFYCILEEYGGIEEEEGFVRAEGCEEELTIL